MTADQCTGAKNAKITAATMLATPRITFLEALACASVASPARSSSREQQHAGRGTEIAAVDADHEDRDGFE